MSAIVAAPRLILLDRDGVVNVDVAPNGVTHVRALKIYDYSAEAIGLLKQHGFSVALVTNQSAIGKGLLDEDGLEAIHGALQAHLQAHGTQIDRIYYCPDHPKRPTHRRKPSDGMLREALADFGAQAAHTPLIGDSLRDMQAAASAGCPAYLVATGNGARHSAQIHKAGLQVRNCTNLLDAAQQVVKDAPHGFSV